MVKHFLSQLYSKYKGIFKLFLSTSIPLKTPIKGMFWTSFGGCYIVYVTFICPILGSIFFRYLSNISIYLFKLTINLLHTHLRSHRSTHPSTHSIMCQFIHYFIHISLQYLAQQYNTTSLRTKKNQGVQLDLFGVN